MSVIVNCDNCSQKVIKLPSRVGLRNFCSRKRFGEYVSSKKPKTLCDNCGKEFYKKPSIINKSNNNFCSHKCKGEYWKQNKINYRVGIGIGRSNHGMRHTRINRIWIGMKQRCINSNNSKYKNYGAKGIEVCDEWMFFENFRDDMHESYLKHVEQFGEKQTTIDRKNNNLGYFKENCQWATYSEQNNNRGNNLKL